MATDIMMPVETMQLRAPMAPKSSGTKRQPIKLDPLRALEPARKKLSTVEAQRVLAVLEESTKKVEIVKSFPVALENLERFKIVFGAELTELFEKHASIIGSYEELNSNVKKLIEKKKEIEAKNAQIDDMDMYMERPGSGTSQHSHISVTSVDNRLDATLRSIEFVQQQLHNSCKNILRAFASNPPAITALLAASAKRQTQTSTFITGLLQLKDILLEKLLTTPTEETQKIKYLQQVSQQERYNSSVIIKLEAELKAATDEKEKEISKKNEVIRRLKGDIHQIEKFSEDHIRRTTSDAEKQEAADEKNSEGKRQKLQTELSTLKTQLQNFVVEHRDSEQNLRKRKYKIETEVENWITKYDQDIGDKQDEYERIDEIYTEEKKQLNELEERFTTLETEYNQIQEERRIAREKREAAEREMQMMIKASTTIQAFWRSYKVRKTLKAKKKGKGKKGKGKKK